MQRRLGNQPNTPEDTRKSEHILVFQKSGGTVFKDFHCQQILPILQIRRQIKFRTAKAIFGVAHKLAVEPEKHGLFDTVKFNANPLID